tara:strand:+ start:38 stop:361 length:324 start_codon:yes stop_codon:yes gene_type:complete
MAKYGTNGKVVDRLGNMPKGESLTSLYRDGDGTPTTQPAKKPKVPTHSTMLEGERPMSALTQIPKAGVTLVGRKGKKSASSASIPSKTKADRAKILADARAIRERTK